MLREPLTRPLKNARFLCRTRATWPASEAHTPLNERLLHLRAYQYLHASTVQRLPFRLPYPRSRLPEVGRPLYDLVAREGDQIERLLSTSGALLGPVLDPY